MPAFLCMVQGDEELLTHPLMDAEERQGYWKNHAQVRPRNIEKAIQT